MDSHRESVRQTKCKRCQKQMVQSLAMLRYPITDRALGIPSRLDGRAHHWENETEEEAKSTRMRCLPTDSHSR
jgi:hypothetical protein